MTRYPVPEARKLVPGEKLATTVNGRRILVVNVEGELAAVGNICAHQGGPIADGGIFDEFSARVIDGEAQEFIASRQNIVACPWHGWEYDLKTGQCLWNRKYRIATYKVETDPDGTVNVCM
jgi:nitrite reductase (NADH) small subunit